RAPCAARSAVAKRGCLRAPVDRRRAGANSARSDGLRSAGGANAKHRSKRFCRDWTQWGSGSYTRPTGRGGGDFEVLGTSSVRRKSESGRFAGDVIFRKVRDKIYDTTGGAWVVKVSFKRQLQRNARK